MRGRKNPPLDLTPVPEGTPLTFDTLATTYWRTTCYSAIGH